MWSQINAYRSKTLTSSKGMWECGQQILQQFGQQILQQARELLPPFHIAVTNFFIDAMKVNMMPSLPLIKPAHKLTGGSWIALSRSCWCRRSANRIVKPLLRPWVCWIWWWSWWIIHILLQHKQCCSIITHFAHPTIRHEVIPQGERAHANITHNTAKHVRESSKSVPVLLAHM